MIYNDTTNKWQFVHHALFKMPKKGNNIHHKDFNYLNNEPDNLVEISKQEHSHIHMLYKNKNNKKFIESRNKAAIKNIIKYNKSDKHKETVANMNKDEDMIKLQHISRLSTIGKKLIILGYTLTEDLFINNRSKTKSKIGFNLPTIGIINKYFDSFNDFIQQSIKKQIDFSVEQNNVDILNRQKIIKESMLKMRRNSCCRIGKLVLEQGLELNEENYMNKRKELNTKCPRYDTILKYFDSYKQFEEGSKYYNHKIISKEYITLDKPVNVYCLTVDKYHNFAINLKDNNNGVFVKNCDADGIDYVII